MEAAIESRSLESPRRMRPLTVRPFEKLHLGGMANSAGVNSLTNYGVQTIALKVPICHLSLRNTK